MRLDRDQKAGKYLEWKVRLFSVAAITALVGIYLDVRWMVGVAILTLLAGMSLRFLGDPRNEDVEEAD